MVWLISPALFTSFGRVYVHADTTTSARPHGQPIRALCRSGLLFVFSTRNGVSSRLTRVDRRTYASVTGFTRLAVTRIGVWTIASEMGTPCSWSISTVLHTGRFRLYRRYRACAVIDKPIRPPSTGLGWAFP